MYKFQIRTKGSYNFRTIAQFYNNPENDSMHFLIDLLINHFHYWESKTKTTSKNKFSVYIDFSDYKFTLSYKENGQSKSEVYEFRYYKEALERKLIN